MDDSKKNLAHQLPDLYKNERRATPAPSTEEILAYVEGALEPAEEEALRERLALHPAATQQFLDLADPARIPFEDDDEALLPDREAMRRQLKDEGIFEPPAASVTPFPAALPRPGVNPLYRWAAAALVVLSLGLGAELVRRAEGPAPPEPIQVALWEILPSDDEARRDGGESIEAAAGFTHNLALYGEQIEPGEIYRVTIETEGRTVLERELLASHWGRVILSLAAQDLEPGRYVVNLIAAQGLEAPTKYDLEWKVP